MGDGPWGDRDHESHADRLSALAPVFGRAFIDEPMMRQPIGDRGDVVDRFTRCFSYFLEKALGLGIVWEAGHAKGAAAWVPPDLVDGWDDHPWNQPRIDALTEDGGRRYNAFWEWIESRSPASPCGCSTRSRSCPRPGAAASGGP